MTLVTFIDLVLVMVAVEAILLWWFAPRIWPQVARAALLATLAAGATLILALRAVAHGAALGEVMLWLSAALAAHLLDLSLRLRP
jgi:hypothetical protein